MLTHSSPGLKTDDISLAEKLIQKASKKCRDYKENKLNKDCVQYKFGFVNLL